MVCSVRFGIAVLAFFGFFITNAQRTSIGVAVVCMVNQTYLKESQLKNPTPSSNDSSALNVQDTCRNDMKNFNESEVIDMRQVRR